MTFKEISVDDYEKVLEIKDESRKLHAFIAIHDSTLGPALGGTRFYPYETVEAAFTDVLRLSKGMTHKSALAETGFGGAKSVIIADPKKDKTEELLHAFAEAVDTLKGKYICAEDSGISVHDMLVIHQRTPYVAGLPTANSSGDPSRFTAWGVYKGIKAVAKQLWGNDSLKGRTIAIQGLGSVGSKVAEFLFWEEVNLILCDVDSYKVAALTSLYHAQSVSPQKILQTPCDILAPCAMGGILNEKTIPHLQCAAVAGAANNQLWKSEDGDLLAKRGILYAPDFVINAGGVINVSLELEKELYNPQRAIEKVNHLYDTLTEIFEIAKEKRISTQEVAIELAEYKRKHGIGKRTHKVQFHTTHNHA